MLLLPTVEWSGAAPNASENLKDEKLCTTIRAVPGLPKTIEKVVMMCRRGEAKSGILPVRTHKAAKNRATLT